MNRNALLTLIAFLLFAAAGSWFYLCKVKQVCEPRSQDAAATLGTSISHSIAFSWESETAMKGKTFESVKTQLLTDIGLDNTLQIIGLYDQDEANHSIEADLGLARANSIRDLFPEIANDQILVQSEAVGLDQNKDYFRAAELNVILQHESIFETYPDDSISE